MKETDSPTPQENTPPEKEQPDVCGEVTAFVWREERASGQPEGQSPQGEQVELAERTSKGANTPCPDAEGA